MAILRLERAMVVSIRWLVFSVLPPRMRPVVRDVLVSRYTSMRLFITNVGKSPGFFRSQMRAYRTASSRRLRAEGRSLSEAYALCFRRAEPMPWLARLRLMLPVSRMVYLSIILSDYGVFRPFYVYAPEHGHLEIVYSVGDLPGTLHHGYVSPERADALLREGRVAKLSLVYRDRWGLLPRPNVPNEVDFTNLLRLIIQHAGIRHGGDK